MKKVYIIFILIFIGCIFLCSCNEKYKLKASDFNCIIPGESTFEDVLSVDENAVYCTKLTSWGSIGYHELSDGTFMVITYYYDEEYDNIVYSKQIVLDKDDAIITPGYFKDNNPIYY